MDGLDYSPYEVLEQKLGYRFTDKQLLLQALTHKTYSENDITQYNERLEFLGDSVLELVIGERLYALLPQAEEGELSRVRSKIVCRAALSACARTLSLGTLIRFGASERRTGSSKDSILENAYEALIGAIYLDAGLEGARAVILRTLADKIDAAQNEPVDSKTRLQEVVQAAGDTLTYDCLDATGPDHRKMFTVGVRINGRIISQAVGNSKKLAASSAAEAALKLIDERGYARVSKTD